MPAAYGAQEACGPHAFIGAAIGDADTPLWTVLFAYGKYAQETFRGTSLICSDRCQSVLFLSVYRIVRGHIPSESVTPAFFLDGFFGPPFLFAQRKGFPHTSSERKAMMKDLRVFV